MPPATAARCLLRLQRFHAPISDATRWWKKQEPASQRHPCSLGIKFRLSSCAILYRGAGAAPVACGDVAFYGGPILITKRDLAPKGRAGERGKVNCHLRRCIA
eukprot:514212-Prymnesium_polylepis.1